MESFYLRDAEFQVLGRNANVDIKEAVQTMHLVFRGEVWAEIHPQESSVNSEHLHPCDWVSLPRGRVQPERLVQRCHLCLTLKCHESRALVYFVHGWRRVSRTVPGIQQLLHTCSCDG